MDTKLIAGVSPQEFIERCDELDRLSNKKLFDAKGLTEVERQKIIDTADKIADGFVFFNDTEPVQIGMTDIDWFGGQKKHQEWIAQLNRFFMLSSLGEAFLLTGDEKYPARAKVLIDDYRYFLEVKHGYEFFDAQSNNRLNISLRINNWIDALRRMGTSSSFDGAFINRMTDTLMRQIKSLDDITVPGAHNFFAAQSDALVMAGLHLIGMPGMDKVLKHGAEVFEKSIQMQFRQDGTQIENSCGYHTWMTTLAGKYRRLAKHYPFLKPGLTDQQFLEALNYTHLTREFPINDYQTRKHFPQFIMKPDACEAMASQIGIHGWKPLLRKSFMDAGMFYGGNEDEHLFFDSTNAIGWHQNNARLNVLYAAYGFHIIADYGCKNYEGSSPFMKAGMEAASHATCQPDELDQLHVANAAETNLVANEPDYAVFSGTYNANYGKWNRNPDNTQVEVRAAHKRTVIWLPGEYIHITDCLTGPEVNKPDVWNFNFPVPEQEDYTLDQEKCIFITKNANRPNFVIRMISAPKHADCRLVLCYGQTEPEYRGWRSNYPEGMPMPLLRFQVKNMTDGDKVQFLIAARPAGQNAPNYAIENHGHATAILRPDGGKDVWHEGGDTSLFAFNGERAALRFTPDGKQERRFLVNVNSVESDSFDHPKTGFF